VEYRYNRQGEKTQMKDQNGSVHAYLFDGLGRQVEDRVTTLGAGVDGAVRRIAQTFEVRGLAEKITSFDDPTAGSVVNQVQLAYNEFAQVSGDYQAHAGAVSMPNSPVVIYGYTDGSAGHARRTRITYPNGRLVHYRYDSGADEALNRTSAVAEDIAGYPESVADYYYLGVDQAVQIEYPEPELLFTLAHGSGNDPYDGLDRFDRIVDMQWKCCFLGGNSSSSGSGCELELVERIKYGYDRASNRIWREMPVAASHGVSLDELYRYDGLHRLVDFNRGDLNASHDTIYPLARKQQWELDATGNWSRFIQFDQSDGSLALDQARSHNAVNEITDVHERVGLAWITPDHDRNGNMVRIPQPANPTAYFQATYDAWNRLVKLTDGTNTIAEYQYDGRNFRTVKKTYSEGVLSETRHFCYSDQWQVLEERLGVSTAAERQFVRGPRYIDDLVLRDRDTSLPADGTLDERLYAFQDANWNVTAISDPTGTIQERYSYDAYGRPGYLTPAFDFQSGSDYAWESLFTGRALDSETGLNYYRARYYDAGMGKFTARDPKGYGIRDPKLARHVPSSLLARLPQTEADLNLYAYVGNSPIMHTDPSGTVRVACGFPSTGFPFPSGPSWSFDFGPDIPGCFTAKASIGNCSAVPGIPVLKIPLTPGGCAGVTNDALRSTADLIGSHYSGTCQVSEGCPSGETCCPITTIKTVKPVVLPMVGWSPAIGQPTCLGIVVSLCNVEESISIGTCKKAAPSGDPFQR
jgi:RHS repeat-associated protein